MTEQTVVVENNEVSAEKLVDENTQKTEVVEAKTDDKVEAKDDTATAKDDADASLAAKTLADRKAAKAERFRTMERNMHDANRRAEAAERRLAEYDKIKRPDPANYDDLDKLEDDRIEHQAAKLRAKDAEHEAKESRQEAARLRQSAFNDAVADYKADAPDFDLDAFIKAGAGGAYENELTEAILDDPDAGIRLIAALSGKPSEIRRIVNMPPRQMMREIALIELKASQVAPKKVTQAPEPIKGVTGTNRGSASRFSDLSQDDYAKQVLKEMRG